MPRIFISYRRQDSSGHAGRLNDRLTAEFGRDRIFMDIDAIDVGVDFVARINEAVGECDALIAVIGDEWLAADQTGRRRLDDPADFVRLEIAAALERDVRVIPALVAGALPMTADQLPEPLKRLANRHAIELSDSRWDYDVGRLIERLRELDGGDGGPSSGWRRLTATARRHGLKLAGAAAGLVALGALAAFLLGGGDDTDSGNGLTEDEQSLTASVAAPLRASCYGKEPTQAGSVAAIECAVPNADYLILEAFADRQSMDRVQQQYANSLRAAKEPCGPSEWNVTLPWKSSSVSPEEPPLGQLSCYSQDGTAVMTWSDEAKRAVAWIGRADGNRGLLVQAWSRVTAY